MKVGETIAHLTFKTTSKTPTYTGKITKIVKEVVYVVWSDLGPSEHTHSVQALLNEYFVLKHSLYKRVHPVKKETNLKG